MDAALVEFIEDDAADALEEGIGLEAAGEDPLGEDMEEGVGAGAVFEADLPADFAADLPALFAGDAVGDGTRGDAAGLEEEDSRSVTAVLRELVQEERGGDAGGLAGAGGGNDHRGAAPGERLLHLGDQRVDREGGERGHGHRETQRWAGPEGSAHRSSPRERQAVKGDGSQALRRRWKIPKSPPPSARRLIVAGSGMRTVGNCRITISSLPHSPVP